MTDDHLIEGEVPRASPDTATRSGPPASRLRNTYESFYRDQIGRLVWFVRTSAGATVEEAWDAAQAAMVEAWNKWENVERPVPFVRKVAFRAFYRQIPNREVTRDAPVPDHMDSALTPDLVVELTESTARIVHLLEQLSTNLRLPFALHLDGVPVTEIAEITGKTEDTVRKNISRARAAVKKTIIKRGGAR